MKENFTLSSFVTKDSEMKASSKRKSSSATFCFKGNFKATFFFIGLTNRLDDFKGKEVGVPSNTV